MLAYQMIYTACGKDKTGAFSVWAKSNEVSKTECDEIIRLMSYRKPKNAPYEPTEEEIRTLFPKKYGYFVLSSGRKCIAQSSYIGQVYSDLDGRSGNFLIHAYIFDKLENNCPFGVIKTDIFKTELTYKEWHDDPAPDNLPAADISFTNYLNEAEIKQFMSDSAKAQALASLIQSVINSSDNESVVTFNSTEAEQKTIYSIFGILLPKKLYETATFSNQYSPQVEFALASTGIKLTKIRNIFEPGGYSSAFNYDEEIAAGHYAFNFERSLFANVPLNRYVTDIINTLKTKTLFETLKQVEQIDKLMQDLQSDADTAICAYNAINNNFDWFNGADEFIATLNLLSDAKYIDNVAYAKNINLMILKPKRWGFNRDIVSLIKYVYKYSDESVKDSIMYETINSLESFGISKKQVPEAFLNSLKAELPFDFADLNKVVLRSSSIAGLFADSNDPALIYAYLDIVCSILFKRPDAEISKKMQQEILKIFRKAVATEDFRTIKLYLDRIDVLGAKAEEWVINNSIPNLLNTPIKNRDDLRFAFEIALILNNDDTQYKLVKKLVENNLNSADFMPVYLEVCKNNKDLFEKIENGMKNDGANEPFFIRKSAYVFKNTPVTARTLERYFKDYYLKGYDSGIFLIKFEEYISSIENTQVKIRELFDYYDNVAKLKSNFGDVNCIIEFIENEIYSVDMDDLLKLRVNQITKLGEINERIMEENPSASSKKYDILMTVLLLQGRCGKNDLFTAVERGQVYKGLSDRQLDFLAKYYLDLIIETYVELKSSNKLDMQDAFTSLFQDIVIKVGNYKTYLGQAFEVIGGYEYYEFMADAMAYAFNTVNSFATELRSFIDEHVDTLSSGEYKKLFRKVEGILGEKKDYKTVEEYIDEYLDAHHKSFFENLFGILFKKNKDRNKDKKRNRDKDED